MRHTILDLRVERESVNKMLNGFLLFDAKRARKGTNEFALYEIDPGEDMFVCNYSEERTNFLP
jgi:hypothetical protein